MKDRAIGYEPEELAWIEARKTMPRAELYALFCAYWKRRDIAFGAFKSLCKRKGWMTGRTGCFAKGNVSHNKGKPMPDHVRAKASRTMFKAGQVPPNRLGPGHELIDSKDGYVVMLVDEVNPWNGHSTRPVHKHRYLWEQKNGPIPDGHILKCLDGDKTNCDPSNWEAIPQALLPRLNGRWSGLKYDSAPAALKPAVLAVAKLDNAARQARKAQNKPAKEMSA
ncbi:MAG: HNH endonuclease [Paracoccus sp.]|nr:HNH endonuclease [Paracoccus sp. (in: a-proteobacteria)]